MKPHKQKSCKNLSGLHGVRDVSFGKSTPERRAMGDHSKAGMKPADSTAYDDHKERMKRWGMD